MSENKVEKSEAKASSPAESRFDAPVVNEALKLLDAQSKTKTESPKDQPGESSSAFLDFGDSAALYGSSISQEKVPEKRAQNSEKSDRSKKSEKSEKSSAAERKTEGTERKSNATNSEGQPDHVTNKEYLEERRKLDRLSKLVRKEDQEFFRENLNQFEDRAKKMNVPASEVKESYKQLARLLGPEKGTMPAEDREKLAKHMVRHLANPSGIDQGDKRTCNVSTLAERLTTRAPSKACEMVTTAAMTGGWTAPDGTQIKITPESFKPGSIESLN
ncbi:MAG: hypothetical protein SGJ27_06880 [Candidatus Melainabacteria bacterium]|nr:hypothetical protein [Candidatus Melainabacteria bacterium]